MRFKSLMAAGTMALALAACGDDPIEEPNCDASQLGHGESLPEECGVPASFGLDEGGEIRVFVARRPIPDVRNNWLQATFFKGQNPGKRPFDSSVTFNDECMNFTPQAAGGVFDSGPSAAGQAIADTRTYVDVGANVVLKAAANGTDYPLEKLADTKDPYNGLQHDILYRGNMRTMLSNDTAMVPVGTEFEVQNVMGLTKGVDLEQKLAPEKASLRVPADFEITSYNPAMVQKLTRGQDLTITHSAANADPAERLSVFFYNPDNDELSTVCVGEADGTLTVPAAAIDLVANTLANGQIGVGKFVHRAYEMDGRRVDLVGMNCLFTEYSFDP